MGVKRAVIQAPRPSDESEYVPTCCHVVWSDHVFSADPAWCTGSQSASGTWTATTTTMSTTRRPLRRLEARNGAFNNVRSLTMHSNHSYLCARSPRLEEGILEDGEIRPSSESLCRCRSMGAASMICPPSCSTALRTQESVGRSFVYLCSVLITRFVSLEVKLPPQKPCTLLVCLMFAKPSLTLSYPWSVVDAGPPPGVAIPFVRLQRPDPSRRMQTARAPRKPLAPHIQLPHQRRKAKTNPQHVPRAPIVSPHEVASLPSRASHGQKWYDICLPPVRLVL